MVNHGIDRIPQLQYFSLRFNCNLFGEIPPSYCSCHVRYIPDLVGQVACHLVYIVSKFPPNTANAFYPRLSSEFPFCTNFACHARNLRSEHAQLSYKLIYCIGRPECLPLDGHASQFQRDFL